MPLNVCLIGVGHMGKIHARKLASMADVCLNSIVDVDTHKGNEAAVLHSCQFHETCGDAIATGAHAAVIASITDTHYPLARELLEHNVHVFIEKPIAATPEQARALIELARKKRLVLQIGHLERFSPPFKRASALIADPVFIEAQRIGAFTGRSTDIDVVHDLMIHDLDLVLSLTKSPVRMLNAYGTSVFTDKIDVAHATIEFESGCVAALTASRASSVKERTLKVLQKDRFFALDLGAGTIYSAPTTPEGKRYTFRAEQSDPVQDELKSFLKAVKGKGQPLVTGEDGLQALLLADSISRYIEKNSAAPKANAV